MAKDFLVECFNPDDFDKTIQQLGAAALIEDGQAGKYIKKGGFYVMRVFNNADYIKFAIHNQGYGRVIKEL